MNEPSVLTRMRLSCCWGDNLNEKELNEVVDYINHLQRENKQLQQERDKYKSNAEEAIEYIEETQLNGNKISEMLCGSEIVKLLEILKELEEGNSND